MKQQEPYMQMTENIGQNCWTFQNVPKMSKAKNLKKQDSYIDVIEFRFRNRVEIYEPSIEFSHMRKW